MPYCLSFRAKIKPVHDPCSKSEKLQSGHGGVMVDPIPSPPHPMSMPPGAHLGGSGPKALWSGLKNTDSSAYSLNHHPINPELLSHYERVDYGAVGQTRPLPSIVPHYRMTPPPLPANPPPPICPTYCSVKTEPTTVCIMGNGDAYYANPDPLDGSFENGAFVDSECSMEVRRVAPDGAVVCRRGRPYHAAVHGGDWERASEKSFDCSAQNESRPTPPIHCRDQASKIGIGPTRFPSFEARRFAPPMSASPLV